MPTIDGRQWKKQRIEFLRSLLAENPSDDERSAIERELAELTMSRSRWRWLWPMRLPHEHE